jgi:hypothetical protein
MVDGIVGRQRELETLRACLDAACDGAGRLVLRHLADQVAGARLLVLAAFRDVEPARQSSGVTSRLGWSRRRSTNPSRSALR